MISDPHVLFAGMRPGPDSPLVSRANALRRVGVKVAIENKQGGFFAWLAQVLRADVVVAAFYGGMSPTRVRRLAAAAVLGRSIVRWWVGTDVLRCMADPSTRRMASRLDRIISKNLTGAPHLVAELGSLGICASCIPSPTDAVPAVVTSAGPIPRGILTYLPTDRAEFYGAAMVERMVEANPDMRFLIVGDTSRALLAEYSNVDNLGWVEDLEAVYGRIGCLMRLTEHDGMPRMVLDCLLRGRYVISPWPYPGVWQARSEKEVQQALDRFRGTDAPNFTGAGAAHRLLTPDPASRFRDAICDQATRRNFAGRAAALGLLVRASFGSIPERRKVRQRVESPNEPSEQCSPTDVSTRAVSLE